MSFKTTLALFLIPIIANQAFSKNILPQSSTADTKHPVSVQTKLFKLISNQNEMKNIIISPYSIISALTLLYMGAEGHTAQEFERVLKFKSNNKTETAEKLLLLKKLLLKSNSDLVQIQSANRIYTSFDLVREFNEQALKYFQAEAEQVDFNLKKQTADKINAWVEENTNKKIQNLISPESIDDSTTAMLVNAIYFKAQWFNQFSKHMTKKRAFHLNETNSIDVDTMSGEITCKYSVLTDFDATAIELKYEDTDMVMDVILPNKVNGLRDLIKKISTKKLFEHFENIEEEEVNVQLPKFKIAFETGLIPFLIETGFRTSFDEGANFSGIFNTSVPVKISDVVHKAFIEVNEFGSEAAAATYTKLVYLSAFSQTTETFKADHPFMFVIRNKGVPFFIGHVKHFEN